MMSDINNRDILNKLKRKLPGYEKGNDVFESLNSNICIAIKNAKKLEEYHLKNGLNIKSVEANPHSEIYKVIENFVSK